MEMASGRRSAIRRVVQGERFCAHATSLAQSQEISHDYVPVRTVVTRLHNNARVLLKSYTELAEAAADGKPVTPAAEWLIDNYYLIESHIRQAIEDLPASYYRQLPKIASGPLWSSSILAFLG